MYFANSTIYGTIKHKLIWLAAKNIIYYFYENRLKKTPLTIYLLVIAPRSLLIHVLLYAQTGKASRKYRTNKTPRLQHVHRCKLGKLDNFPPQLLQESNRECFCNVLTVLVIIVVLVVVVILMAGQISLAAPFFAVLG